MTPEERIAVVLRETQPLRFPRGERLPLFVWPAMDLPGDEAQVEATLRALDARGIAACASWHPGRNQQQSLDRALRMSALQKRLGLLVNINANACTYSICDGSDATAHLDAEGKPFFDTSSEGRKLGCPFRLQHRYPAMREQVDFFCRAYAEKGVEPNFVFADWEIDGPIEWNGGWDAARRCAVCRKNIPKMDDFLEFQKAYRRLRSEIQRECYASVVLKRFPKALVGNYGVYPHGGWRHWYDYFEGDPPKGCPVKLDGRAPYRPWPVEEFADCGYTFAMPVVYTWYRIWSWYDWPQGDYRWFYALLLEASGVGQATPAGTPIITFVHHTTTSPPKDPDPAVKQFSSAAYRELLWHMLLRGHATFFLWCPDNEIAQEVKPLHETWAAALEFREFLDKGEPVTFDVPRQPGPVVSALRLGDRLLVRRTDFTDARGPVALRVGEKTLAVPRAEGKSQVLPLAD